MYIVISIYDRSYIYISPFFMIMIIFFNIIHLIRSLYVYWNKSSRRSEWIRYFDFQNSNQLDNTQIRHFIDYMDDDGYYVFIILQKNLTFEDFQEFFELFTGITFNEVHQQINIEN